MDRPPKQAMTVARQEDLGLCVHWSLSLSLQSVQRCKKMALYVQEEWMFWYSLVGADRPPTKQAMPVARQEYLDFVSFGRSLCRYSPFHAVKKWHCMFRSERGDFRCSLVGADRPPKKARPA